MTTDILKEKLAGDKAKAATIDDTPGMKYFFSSSRRFQGHFKDEEKYHNGETKQMATVIQFEDNMHATDDPDEIECIRGWKSFGIHVKECKDMKEVESYRQARTLQRLGKMAGVLYDDNLTVEEAPIVAVAGAGQ